MLDKYPLEKVIEKESFLPALGELFKSTNGYRGKKKGGSGMTKLILN